MNVNFMKIKNGIVFVFTFNLHILKKETKYKKCFFRDDDLNWLILPNFCHNELVVSQNKGADERSDWSTATSTIGSIWRGKNYFLNISCGNCKHNAIQIHHHYDFRSSQMLRAHSPHIRNWSLSALASHDPPKGYSEVEHLCILFFI